MPLLSIEVFRAFAGSVYLFAIRCSGAFASPAIRWNPFEALNTVGHGRRPWQEPDAPSTLEAVRERFHVARKPSVVETASIDERDTDTEPGEYP